MAFREGAHDLSRSSDMGDDTYPLCARRAQFSGFRRSQPVRTVRQRVSGHRPALEPDRCRAGDDRKRPARHRVSDPDRRGDRHCARQARRHRPDDGGDGAVRRHHFRRSDLLADCDRHERPGRRRRRLRSCGLGAYPRFGDEGDAGAAARAQLGFRPRRQYCDRAPRGRGRIRVLAARRLSHGSGVRRLDLGGRARHSSGCNQPRPGERPFLQWRSARKGGRISHIVSRRVR